jgi:DNA ligase (NAD+)
MGAITKLLSVELSIGHTGAIIPTAKVAPVQIGGVTVTSCLLNNYEEIERLGVALNDDVDIIRAGDVIPKITSVAKKSPDRIPIEIPTKCISCGSTLEKDGAHIFCKNDDCEGKAIRRLKTWVTKREIKFLGDELLITLYERGYKEPQDIYRLSEKDISTMPRGAGVVGSAAKQIMIEINKSRKCSLADFIGSLAIKLMGRRQAEILINQGIDSLEKFVVLSVEQLNVLPGFSEDGSKATSIVEGLKKSRPIIKALIEAGIEIEEVTQKAVIDPNGPLKNKIFVFTGALPSGLPRGDAWARTNAAGGQIKDSITKGVDYLVLADPSSNSSKTQKANKYGIKCISEEEWVKMMAGE